MIDKVRNRMKYRHKQFLRYKAPVYYLDKTWNWNQADEFETWVSVAATHKYMLHFPHNFKVLSLGTMGIITSEFGNPDGEGDILGYCDKSCFKRKMMTPRCTLTWKDLQQFMSDVTKDKDEWNLICLQLDYDVSDVIRNPNLAIPDLFYYWRFLRQLFSKRPFFGIGISKDDFVHYNCYDNSGKLDEEELLMKYFVILIIAGIMWLYSPLLIYYFPSSKATAENYPHGLNHKDFHPTYKSPVYFGYFVRCVLCFYMEEYKGFKSRARRFIFVSCAFMASFRFIYTPYRNTWAISVLVLIVAALIPEFLSTYLGDQHPTHFLGRWKYPESVFRKNTRKKEYQFLAHCMQERIYLALDLRFLKMLCRESFKSPLFSKAWGELYANFPSNIVKVVLSVLVCTCTLVFALLLAVVSYLTPAFYFYYQLLSAIWIATADNVSKAWHDINMPFYGYNALLSVIRFLHGIILTALLFYLMLAMMYLCYLVAEVTMFTYIGAVLDPSMAFKYVALVGAISLLLHKIAKDLRENYDELQDQVVKVLESSDHFTQLKTACEVNHQCTLKREDKADGSFEIHLTTNSRSSEVILHHDHFATYLSRPLLDFCIEDCDPLRRQMLFILVKVFLMTFYLLIAMWIKNVFHKEKEVSSIFIIAQTIATYFVPNLLQFLAHKSRFGKKDDVLLHRRVHEAMAAYIKR